MSATTLLLLLALLAMISLAAAVKPIATTRKICQVLLLTRGVRYRHIETDRAVVYYYQIDSPRQSELPVVFLTGLGGSATDWSGSMLAVARSRRVFCVELAGQGRTRLHDDSQPYGLDLQVDLLREFLDRKQLAAVILVAISLGGWIACRFAVEYPDRLKRLVLVDSAGLRGDLAIRDFQPQNRREAQAFANRLLARKRWIPSLILDDMRRRLNSPNNLRVLNALRESDFVEEGIRKIFIPVDIIWGSHDGLFPVEHAHQFNSNIPGSRLHILPDCGHVPMVECPSRFRTLLLTILNKSASMVSGAP